MPGRQSTRTPLLKRPKIIDHKQKRSLNALSIAEKQNPSDDRIRPNRLGEIEGNKSKSRRDNEQQEVKEDGGVGQAKRKRGADKDLLGSEIKNGSDSDGNEWMVGHVDSEDDSDLDSDEAMGSSDEEKFEGFIFRGSSNTGSKRTRVSSGKSQLKGNDFHETELREKRDGRQHSEDSDGLGDGAVDLATLLDASNGDREKSPETEVRGKTQYATNSLGDEDRVSFGNGLSDSGDSILSGSEAEDESSKLISLQAFVADLDTRDRNTSQRYDIVDKSQESLAPSEYNLSTKTKLTIADLIPSITDSHLKKSLKILADGETSLSRNRNGIPKKLEVPLPRRQQDLLDRAAAYEKSKETLSRWISTVKYNRRAEHLSFPLPDLETAATHGAQSLPPKISSRPLTDLEIAIQNILQDSGLIALGDGLKNEDEESFKELPANKVSSQDIQARRAELRRARDLLFREETRSKRIKKIKSKSYRRVHRKERERHAQLEQSSMTAAGMDDSEGEQERNDRRRAEERMGARHRESKWAKGIKDTGRAAWDEDARNGVIEMATRAEDLKARIAGREIDGGGDNSDSLDSDSDDSADQRIEDQNQARLRKVQRKLEELDEDAKDYTYMDTPKTGLSSMKFMKNADALRKARNDANVESLRKELVGEQSSMEEDTEEASGRRSYGPARETDSKIAILQKRNQSEFDEGEITNSDNEVLRDTEEKGPDIVIDRTYVKSRNGVSSKNSLNNQKSAQRSRPDSKHLPPENLDNPWLSISRSSAIDDKKKRDSDVALIISKSHITEKTPAHISDCELQSKFKGTRTPGKKPKIEDVVFKNTLKTSDSERESEDERDRRSPFLMRNQDLIRKAFAGDEVVADFEKEKAETMLDEEEKVIDNTLPGWGNWTGIGISKRERNKNKVRDLVKQDGVKREKRQDIMLHRVIINEKRVKKVSGGTRKIEDLLLLAYIFRMRSI